MAKKPKFTQGDDKINLGGGDDVANAKGGNDIVSGGSGDDRINGGAGNDFLRGGTGDDTLNGGADDDRLAGGAGDDTLNGGPGANTVDGGEGDDLVVLDGNFADAKISEDGNGGWVITTAGGTTKVKNVESFQFADGVKGEDELIVVPPGTGKTFVLTNNVDGPGAVAPAIDTNGTVGDDTYIGANGTLTSAEVIDGKDGKDTLTYRDATSGASIVAPKLSNVETVKVTSIGTVSTEFNLTGSTGVTTLVNEGSSKDLKFSGVAKIAAVEIANATGGNTDIAYIAAAVAGAADAQTLKISGSTLAGISANGIEALTVTLDGKNSATGLTTGAAKVTFDGTGSLSVASATGVAAALAGATTIDGSKAGALTFAIDATKSVTATTGAGDDTIGVSGLDAADKIDAGLGKDTLQMTGADFPTTKFTNVTGFEALHLTAVGAATAVNLDNLANSIVDFKVGVLQADEDQGAGNSVTITNGFTGSTITQYTDSAGFNGALSFSLKTDGAADTLAVNYVNTDITGGVTGTDLQSLTANGVEALTLNFSNATITGATVDVNETFALGSIVAAAATSLKITSTNAVALGATNTTNLSSLTSVDASTVAKDVTLGNGTTQEFSISLAGASVTTGSGNDSVSLSAGATGVLGATDLGTNGATGFGDTLYLKSTLAGQTVVELGSATDQITSLAGQANIAAQKGIESIDLSGMAAGTAIVNGSAVANNIVTTAGTDAVNAGSGDDSITGGLLGDNIDGGAGNDIYVQLKDSSTTIGAITDTNADAAGALDSTDIVQMPAGTHDQFVFVDGQDKLDLPGAGGSLVLEAGDETNAFYGVGNNEYAVVRGTWNVGTGAFVVDTAAGVDKLLIYDADSTAGVDVEAVILKGAGAATIDTADFL